MELAAKSILSLHAFTGCDTTSALCGKGKVKPLNILLKSSHNVNTFANIGVDASLGDDTLNVLQQFVCDLYGHKGDNTNTLRYRFYSRKQRRLKAKKYSSMSQQPQFTCCTCDLSIICVEKLPDSKI